MAQSGWHKQRIRQMRQYFEDIGYKILYHSGETPMPDLILYSESVPHITFVEVQQQNKLRPSVEKQLLRILRSVKGKLVVYLGAREKGASCNLEEALIEYA